MEYCSTLDESHFEQCQRDLAGSYVEMLYMISHHYFNDGAIHVCEAAGICDVRSMLLGDIKEPRPSVSFLSFTKIHYDSYFRYTCRECVEGLELVGAYIKDPLWVAEYTVYLELNFCVNRPEPCVELVKRHFPPMHNLAMDEFWLPQDLCNMQEVCGATKPPLL